MPIQYDPKQRKSLLRWKGTLWEGVFSTFTFWFLFSFSLLLAILRYTEVLLKEDTPQIPTFSLSTLSALVSLAVVFFLNTVYNRFHEQIAIMVGLGGNVINIVGASTSFFRGHFAQQRAVDLARYGNALNHMCFYAIAGRDNFDFLIESQILTLEETQIIRNFTGKKTNLMSIWMMDVISKSVDDGTLDHPKIFIEMVVQVRSNASKLIDYQRFPVPLGYFHFLTVCLYSYLLLLAYWTPFVSEDTISVWVALLCYVVVLISFLGVMNVAAEHFDAWGKDPSDVDILSELDSVQNQCKQFLDVRFRPVMHDDFDPTEINTDFKNYPMRTSVKAKSFHVPLILRCCSGVEERFKQSSSRNTELESLINERHRAKKEYTHEDMIQRNRNKNRHLSAGNITKTTTCFSLLPGEGDEAGTENGTKKISNSLSPTSGKDPVTKPPLGLTISIDVPQSRSDYFPNPRTNS